MPTYLEAFRILLPAGRAHPHWTRRRRPLVVLDQAPRALGVGRFEHPDFRVGMGERQVAHAALRMLIEDARRNTGVRQTVQDEVGLLQVSGAINPLHETIEHLPTSGSNAM